MVRPAPARDSDVAIVVGGDNEQTAREAFAEQIAALIEGGPGVGVDLLSVETMTSLKPDSARSRSRM